VADLRQAFILLLLLFCGCSRLSELTPDTLRAAQAQWEKSGPASYRMVVETTGDRIEKSKYEVTVRAKTVIKLVRNGSPLQPEAGDNSYTVEGLFRTLDQEIELKGKPQLLGAPAGFSSYPMARFDSSTGRLLQFQRSVGGTKNNIEIIVREFEIPNQ
jgi:uncharacterized protein DUF6174